MATVREPGTEATQVIEAEHIFGRAPTSSSRLQAGYASAQHASLRWTGKRWVIRDLGSRNGTFVDGERLGNGEERAVVRGTRLSFGKPAEGTWEVLDDAPPAVMVVPIDGGEPLYLAGELLAIPSSDDPQVTIYRGTESPWMIEHSEHATTTITNMQTFIAASRTWRFCCPEPLYETALATGQHDFDVRHLQLSFSVSRDEEHVALRVVCGYRSFDLGSRGHNYLLLTLARGRLADASGGLPETSCGWMYQEDLCAGLGVAPATLNLDVFRVRQQFAGMGVPDAANIIERRLRTRQLRIGSAHLSVVRL